MFKVVPLDKLLSSDNSVNFDNIYQLYSDLSVRQHYLNFKQLVPDRYTTTKTDIYIYPGKHTFLATEQGGQKSVYGTVWTLF